MISITNPKVAGFTPRWAKFRGFSILFDNPGHSLVQTGRRHALTCQVADDPDLTFYKALCDNLARLDLDRLTNTYLFCPLPPPSYHVTVWDGGNDGNVEAVLPEQRHKLRALLAGLPAALAEPNELTAIVNRSPLLGDSAICFRFDQLMVWENSALVACLAAADPPSHARLRQIEADRRVLSAQFRQAYGIAPADHYVPHVSLGYFASQEEAQLALPHLSTWTKAFAEGMAGHVLPFTGASMYGFTDMATFFTTSPSPTLIAAR